MKTALLFSGGMDSTALAAWKRPDLLISVDYGQRPVKGELRAATFLASELALNHVVVKADCSALGSGDLAGLPALAVGPASDWWPFRNQLLITLAGTAALAHGAQLLMIACVKSDGAHADGRDVFVAAMDHVMSLQEGGLRVSAPGIYLSTAELIRASGLDASIIAWTHSCHSAAWSCGQCRGCYKRLAVAKELGYE